MGRRAAFLTRTASLGSQAPDWLSAAARPFFESVLGDLAPDAVEMVDRHAIGMLAEVLSDYTSAVAELRGMPYLEDDRGQRRRNPAAIVREAAAGRIATWSRELCMSSAARARATRVRVMERPSLPSERLLTS